MTNLTQRPSATAMLIIAQLLCTMFFVWDVAQDALFRPGEDWPNLHFLLESAATLALLAAIGFESRILQRLLHRQAHLEAQVDLAAKAFHDLVEDRFDSWGLTTAERDVGHFTVKGISITEIATMRGSAEGTVKSQLNAIYRKAGVGNRGELLSLLIEELMDRRAPDTA